MVFTVVNKTWNYLRHSSPGISENALKKGEHFQGH